MSGGPQKQVGPWAREGQRPLFLQVTDPRAVSRWGFLKVQVMGLLLSIRVRFYCTNPCENGSFVIHSVYKEAAWSVPSQFNNCSCVQGLNSENRVPAPPERVICLRE